MKTLPREDAGTGPLRLLVMPRNEPGALSSSVEEYASYTHFLVEYSIYILLFATPVGSGWIIDVS